MCVINVRFGIHAQAINVINGNVYVCGVEPTSPEPIKSTLRLLPWSEEIRWGSLYFQRFAYSLKAKSNNSRPRIVSRKIVSATATRCRHLDQRRCCRIASRWALGFHSYNPHITSFHALGIGSHSRPAIPSRKLFKPSSTCPLTLVRVNNHREVNATNFVDNNANQETLFGLRVCGCHHLAVRYEGH